jgi:hypothetical protein
VHVREAKLSGGYASPAAHVAQVPKMAMSPLTDEMGLVQRRDLAAATADQVVMTVRPQPLVEGVAGAHVGLGDEAQVTRRRQRAIHRRGVDVGIRLARDLQELRRRHVPARVSQG